jgi:hypothetical protein
MALKLVDAFRSLLYIDLPPKIYSLEFLDRYDSYEKGNFYLAVNSLFTVANGFYCLISDKNKNTQYAEILAKEIYDTAREVAGKGISNINRMNQVLSALHIPNDAILNKVFVELVMPELMNTPFISNTPAFFVNAEEAVSNSLELQIKVDFLNLSLSKASEDFNVLYQETVLNHKNIPPKGSICILDPLIISTIYNHNNRAR